MASSGLVFALCKKQWTLHMCNSLAVYMAILVPGEGFPWPLAFVIKINAYWSLGVAFSAAPG